jgi:hypothetical protein
VRRFKRRLPPRKGAWISAARLSRPCNHVGPSRSPACGQPVDTASTTASVGTPGTAPFAGTAGASGAASRRFRFFEAPSANSPGALPLARPSAIHRRWMAGHSAAAHAGDCRASQPANGVMPSQTPAESTGAFFASGAFSCQRAAGRTPSEAPTRLAAYGRLLDGNRVASAARDFCERGQRRHGVCRVFSESAWISHAQAGRSDVTVLPGSTRDVSAVGPTPSPPR